MDNFKKLDEKRIKEFIRIAQSEAKVELKKTGNTNPSIVEINHKSWQILKVNVRGDEQHLFDNDFDAAAAEHYMYIRFLAGQTGDPACYSAPIIYAAKKIWDQVFGNLQSGQAQGGHPVLPSNPYIVAWGHKGVIHGLADYKIISNGANYELGSAIETLASFAFKERTAKKR